LEKRYIQAVVEKGAKAGREHQKKKKEKHTPPSVKILEEQKFSLPPSNAGKCNPAPER